MLDSKPLHFDGNAKRWNKADRGKERERDFSCRGEFRSRLPSFSCITFDRAENDEQVPFSARVPFEKPTVSLSELQNNDVLARPPVFSLLIHALRVLCTN